MNKIKDFVTTVIKSYYWKAWLWGEEEVNPKLCDVIFGWPLWSNTIKVIIN